MERKCRWRMEEGSVRDTSHLSFSLITAWGHLELLKENYRVEFGVSSQLTSWMAAVMSDCDQKRLQVVGVGEAAEKTGPMWRYYPTESTLSHDAETWRLPASLREQQQSEGIFRSCSLSFYLLMPGIMSQRQKAAVMTTGQGSLCLWSLQLHVTTLSLCAGCGDKTERWQKVFSWVKCFI